MRRVKQSAIALVALVATAASAIAQLGGNVKPYSVVEIPPGVHRLSESIVIEAPCHVRGSGVEVSVLKPDPGVDAFVVRQSGRRGILGRDREWQPSNMGANISGLTIAGKRGDRQCGIAFNGPIDNLRVTDVRWAWLDEPVRYRPDARGSGGMRESWFLRCGTMGCGAFIIEQTAQVTRGDGHNNIQFISCHFNQSTPGSLLVVRNRSRQESLRRIDFLHCFFHTHQRWNDPSIDVSEPWEPLIVVDASEGRMGAINFLDCNMVMGAAHNTDGNLRTGVQILGRPTNLTIRTTYTGGGPVVDIGEAEHVWLELSRVGSAAGSLVRWQGTATHRLESR